MRKSAMRIEQEIPIMLEVEISGLTTRRPWMAPRTDCAGVKMPSRHSPSQSVHVFRDCTQDVKRQG